MERIFNQWRCIGCRQTAKHVIQRLKRGEIFCEAKAMVVKEDIWNNCYSWRLSGQDGLVLALITVPTMPPEQLFESDTFSATIDYVIPRFVMKLSTGVGVKRLAFSDTVV